MTALDIASAAAPHNLNCAIIQQKLDAVGAIGLSVMPKSNATSDPTNANDSKQGGNKNIMNTHMVVASLIAGVTFAAMFHIPGGIEENDKKSIHYGAAKMAFRKPFKISIFSDTAAFTTSLIVVAAWLVRQLYGDTESRTSSVTFHISAVTLLFSILWTIAAFVSATIILIIPANYENLKSTDNKAFDNYQRLWIDEMVLPILPPLYVCITFLLSVSRRFGWGTTSEHAKSSKITTYAYMFTVTSTMITYVCSGSS
ncbi:hypothetical protein SUGI_0549220 [Cryptomeria japonica]|nr:hypothetical protein SUGI_0549220 [Cryptomeria japonica]